MAAAESLHPAVEHTSAGMTSGCLLVVERSPSCPVASSSLRVPDLKQPGQEPSLSQFEHFLT